MKNEKAKTIFDGKAIVIPLTFTYEYHFEDIND